MTLRTQAAVLCAAEGPFELLEVELEAPRADEIQVRVDACGICHTDLECMSLVPTPSVLGHEGTGVVEAVGSAVRDLGPGDRVVLSYPWCGGCAACRAERPYHCRHGLDMSLAGRRLDGSQPIRLDGRPVSSAFFQQSSFARHALALARDAVRIPDDVPATVAAALPCGVQTGAGSILNSLATRPGETVAVFGVGAVGLSAVMAAVLAGARRIVAIDVNAARLALARELGATGAVDAASAAVAVEVLDLTGGGADVVLDTSGRDVALRQATASLAHGGRLGIVTVPDWGRDYRLPIQPLFERAGSLVSIIQGSSVPSRFIPWLIAQRAAGRFPVERLVQAYAFEDIGRAIDDARRGVAIKPVLTMH